MKLLDDRLFSETNRGKIKIAKKEFRNTNPFHWGFEFSDVFENNNGFDIVVGNPPYIQLQKMKRDPEQQFSLKHYKERNYETYDSMGDIYCLFYEQGLSITKKDGILCYITSNKWMRSGYGEKIRKFFLKNNPLILVDLGPDIFETATVDTNILAIQKCLNKNELKALTLYQCGGEEI